MPTAFKFDTDKALAVLNYLASNPEQVTDLDKYKAVKLLFLADKYHLVRYARPIVGGEYRALEFGPVQQDALDLLHALVNPDVKAGFVHPDVVARLQQLFEIDRKFKHPRLSAKTRIDASEAFSRSELAALDRIIAEFGKKNFDELGAITHATPAYLKAWHAKPATAKTAPMEYEDFFLEDADAIDGALEEMLENDAIKRALCVAED